MANQRLKIGIQGVKASFHDVAARMYFHESDVDVEPLECSSFRRLAESLARKETDFAVMAIENTIAGSILPNYHLLEEFRFRVIGEVYQRIELQFMALPGQKLDAIRFAQSHPMAIYQSDAFLARNPHLQVIEASDTAESAKEIAEQKQWGKGAIASRLAASIYNLEILEKCIETNKQNYTRFLVISRGEAYRSSETPDKSSLRFELAHRPGSLLEALQIFADEGINMTKLQSVPILGKPYQYAFHVDIEWTDPTKYEQALTKLRATLKSLTDFGAYKKDSTLAL